MIRINLLAGQKRGAKGAAASSSSAGGQAWFVAYAFIALVTGGALAALYVIDRGVLEEKNNRIVEVVISSVRPTTLMLGKILGIGLAGLTQYAVWASLALVLSAPAAMAMLGFVDAPRLPLHVIGANHAQIATHAANTTAAILEALSASD